MSFLSSAPVQPARSRRWTNPGVSTPSSAASSSNRVRSCWQATIASPSAISLAAASIWVTAAIGILAGIGFYFPLAVTTVLTVLTLSVFRWIERKVPGEFYAHLQVRFPREAVMPEDEFRKFVADQKFSIANLSYFYSVDARFFEYKMVIRTREAINARRLQEALRAIPEVHEFRMSPAGD